MTVDLWTDKAKPLRLAVCSQELREEAAYITAHPNYVPDSIDFFELENLELIRLNIRYGENNSPEEKRLINPEPFVLIYNKGKAGREAPQIFSERKSFPRDLPHLNPVNKSMPSSICLDRGGMQSLYDSQRVEGIITRLARWLEDTEAGSSQHDGWEPTPRGMGISSVSLNIGCMQRYISKRTNRSGTVYGKCGLLYDSHTNNIHNFICFLPESSIKELTPNINHFSLAKKYHQPYEGMKCITDVPVVCIWASDDDIVSYHQPSAIDSLEALRFYAEETGISDRLDFFENSVLHNIKVARGNSHLLLLIVAQRRPKPLIPDIPSDAVNHERSIELIPLVVRLSLEESPKIETVIQCDLLAETTNDLLARMAGLSQSLDKVTVVGCGAVGSETTFQLGKLGVKNITLIDDDIFFPHNVSRHILGNDAIGYRKSHKLKQALETQLPISIAAKNKKLQELSDDELKKIKKQGLLIDCTAELSVTRFTYGNNKLPRVLKTELANDGRLGILSFEGEEHNPSVQDIKACLYKRALINDNIEQWLSSNGYLREVSTGQNCASSTMIMPNYAVSLHVSSFMPKIQQIISKHDDTPGVGINILNESGFPVGWEWFNVPEFKNFVSDSSNGQWDVRVHPEVITELDNLSSQYAPNEAGGFLYGTYDRVNRSISIVHQISPETSQHRQTSITIPASGETDGELVWMKKTAGLLPLLGTWHSHVSQSSSPSSTDKQRMKEIAVANVATPTPFVVLITGTDGISINVVLPHNW